uniref:Cyclin dependent kinase 2 associated protein 1 n=1 Tax=Equus asinus TaxID=9793 RepID=A0A9L0J4D3_EQUAS
MDSPLPLLRLPCHHLSRPPALPPARGLPSRGLAGGGSGGVRQSPRLPAGEPPPGAPSGGKAASSPGPGRSLSGVGAGSCAWPQELLASANPSLSSGPSLVPAHCAHCLRCSEKAALTPSLVFSLASCSPTRWPSLCLQEGVGMSGTWGPSSANSLQDHSYPPSTQTGSVHPPSTSMATSSQYRQLLSDYGPPSLGYTQGSGNSQVPQSKYAELLAIIEELGKEIRPTYAGSKSAMERLKRGIIHARGLVRECLAETERNARS